MAESSEKNGGNLSNLWALLNLSSEGFVLCNKKGEIIYFNQKGADLIKKITGYSINSGDMFYFITPDYARDYFKEHFQKALGGISTETERIIINKNNESLFYAVKYIPVKDSEGRNSYVCISAKDITEEKHIKEALNLQKEISGKLSEFDTLDSALNYILDISIEKTGMDCGGIYLRNEVTDDFELIVYKGISDNFAENAGVAKKGSAKWKVIMNGITLSKQHWEYETNPDDTLLKENLKLVVVLPVKFRNNVLISINIGSHTLEYFTESSNELLNIIGREAGSAVYRIILENKLKQAKK